MSLKMEFVERAAKGEPVAALCREFSVSRQTGHKWIKRFNEQGYSGLDEQSRRPKSAPLATAEELVMAALQAREVHPRWGPIKLQQLLRRRFADPPENGVLKTSGEPIGYARLDAVPLARFTAAEQEEFELANRR